MVLKLRRVARVRVLLRLKETDFTVRINLLYYQIAAGVVADCSSAGSGI